MELQFNYSTGGWTRFFIPEEDIDDVFMAHEEQRIIQIEDSHISIDMSRVISIHEPCEVED